MSSQSSKVRRRLEGFYQEPNWVEEGEPKKPGTRKKAAKKDG